MEEHDVVTCFLRCGTEILLVRRSDDVGSYRGRWGGISGYAEGTPEEAARWEIDEEIGLLDVVELVRSGDPVVVEDHERATRWIVYPFLWECGTRPAGASRSGEAPTIDPSEEIADHEWVQPPAILDRETVPKLWEAYEAIAPTVETVREDADHGAAYVSIRALETLRDRAAAAASKPDSAEIDATELATLARNLRAARPSMRVLATRIDRVMSEADGTPRSIRDRAIAACEAAIVADRNAAAATADRLSDRVLTLSRSGTVIDALRRASPEAVFVAESRPAREGVGVAEELAEELDIALCVDAAIARVIEQEGVETVLVGADTVLADGAVVNKIGTRLAALAAADAGIDCFAVCARDKIAPGSKPKLEAGASVAVYDGDADVRALNPTFEATLAELFDGVVTEDGALSSAEIGSIAREHAELAKWHA